MSTKGGVGPIEFSVVRPIVFLHRTIQIELNGMKLKYILGLVQDARSNCFESLLTTMTTYIFVQEKP